MSCIPLDRLTNNIEYKNWTIVQQAVALRAVCIVCEKCSKKNEMVSKSKHLQKNT